MKSVLLLLSMAAVGCVEDDLTLTINQFVEPDVSCTVQTNGSVRRGQGLLDVGLVQQGGFPGYIAFPEIHNNLPVLMNMSQVQVNAITVTGLNIELLPSADIAAALPASQRKFSVSIAGGRILPGAALAMTAEILPRQVAVLMAPAAPTGAAAALPTVTARIRPLGTRSGDDIEGASIDFPIQICRFCLVAPVTPPAACPAGGFDPATIKAGACNPEEDKTVTCCVSQQQLLCGADVPVMKTGM